MNEPLVPSCKKCGATFGWCPHTAILAHKLEDLELEDIEVEPIGQNARLIRRRFQHLRNEDGAATLGLALAVAVAIGVGVFLTSVFDEVASVLGG